MRRVFLIVAIILIPLVPIVLIVTGVVKKKPTTVTRTTLTVWGTQDEASAFSGLFASYRKTRSYVTINYVKKPSEDFATQLLEGWAQGKGPDIFFVPHSWIGEMSAYAVAMPTDLSVSTIETKKGLFGTQTAVVKPTQKAPSLSDLRAGLVDAATGDIIRNNQVWGLPLSMDTVVLYANNDLLNNSKVFEPAKTWTDLINQINHNQLTVIDDRSTIVQAGVALGTVDNIPHATDLLTLIMMQNGSQMIDETAKKVHLNDAGGLEALNFYTSFAQTKKSNYGWNADMANAKQAFLQGKLVYYFGTYADRTEIAASGLNWSANPMLHLDARGDNDATSGGQRFIDIADYEVAMVAKSAGISNSRKSVLAWNLVYYMSHSSNVGTYLKATNKLSAVKKLLATQQQDQKKAVFASQLLTARSWYHGRNASRADQALRALITGVVNNGTDPKTALNLAAQQVEATL